ncbi:hypothetical protein FB45DRAFT_743273 [Roridomyces roridus]|uniref:Malate dehydrogenase n=1 Tax=Roridomyces roridus TaxID=1738132 RepID=A0AAD7FP60_9AGAR|nr:hypothetical protein FB45DRAFT_743273 [Roridomyces roridus]
MFIFTTLFSLLLVSTARLVSASSYSRKLSGYGKTGCSLSRVKIDLPKNQTMLVAPPTGPDFIGLAIGVQNYTCANSTWMNVGAVAELFDISCLAKSPDDFTKMSKAAYDAWYALPEDVPIFTVVDILAPFPAVFVLGQHYFVNSSTGSLVPKWDFTSAALAGHADAFFIGAKVGDIPAPDGPPAVDWLMLNNTSGALAQQVFRINTVGGDAPAGSCYAGQNPISIKYAPTYWFYGSSVHY